jgi:hypothetical protein
MRVIGARPTFQANAAAVPCARAPRPPGFVGRETSRAVWHAFSLFVHFALPSRIGARGRLLYKTSFSNDLRRFVTIPADGNGIEFASFFDESAIFHLQSRTRPD